MYQGKVISVAMQNAGVAVLTFDAQDKSVNTFNNQAVKEFTEILDLLEAANNIKGLILRSAKKTFIVGADITEFGSAFSAGADGIKAYLAINIKNLNRLEDLPFPTVAAINGIALGGGCELTLACDYRVADTSLRIGLPETQLGIMPGWGGTVRLPRIAGLDTAIDWIASGKEKRAPQALEALVVDAVVAPEQLEAAALHTLNECIAGRFDYKARRLAKKSPMALNQVEAGMAFETAKAFIASKAGKNYPAPVTAVKSMQRSYDKNREEAHLVESEGFVRVATTDVALSLVGLFLNDQLLGKKAKGWQKQAAGEITQAAVVGAGIMGGGIAYQSALKGTPVLLKDINAAGIELGLKEATKLFNKRVERSRMTPLEMAGALNRIDPTLHYADFDNVNMVVEAVVEHPKVKHQVLGEIEASVSDDTIIASNTSTISISYLAGALKRPENFCGMHFFNPVHAMPLVEVIRGEKTSDQAVARTVAYANTLGKKAIVIKNCPGFLVNRVLFPYLAGFSMLVRDGVDYQRIDKVMERWGWPMGPAYLLDVVGLDTAVHAEKVMAQGYPERMQRDFTSCIDVLYGAERLGQKNNKGFYDYAPDKKGKPQKTPSKEAQALVAAGVAGNTDITDEEIIARMMIPMATELTRCLEEGIVETPSEADMALVYGVGFPPFRGGVFRWLDSMEKGALATLSDQYKNLGPLYELPALLAEKVQKGEFFYPRG